MENEIKIGTIVKFDLDPSQSDNKVVRIVGRLAYTESVTGVDEDGVGGTGSFSIENPSFITIISTPPNKIKIVSITNLGTVLLPNQTLPKQEEDLEIANIKKWSDEDLKNAIEHGLNSFEDFDKTSNYDEESRAEGLKEIQEDYLQSLKK